MPKYAKRAVETSPQPRPTAASGGYSALLADIKQRVRHAQTQAMMAVNAELIRLYWDIGSLIHARQQQQGWGAGVIPRLAKDLHNELPEEKGFSERNIKRMLAFYREYPRLLEADTAKVPPPVAQIAEAEKVPPVWHKSPTDKTSCRIRQNSCWRCLGLTMWNSWPR